VVDDHDALKAGRASEAVRRVPGDHVAVYRGWLLTSSQYAAFANAVQARGSKLRTSAEQYEAAHELPGWWQSLRDRTPSACWTTGPDPEGFRRCLAELETGPAVLRDYAKSAKHDWETACYIPDVTDLDAADRVAQRFLEVRDTAFTGGFVVRRFEAFIGPELRSWWVDGELALVGAHPDTPDVQPDVTAHELAELRDPLRALGLPFVTATSSGTPMAVAARRGR